MEHAFSFAQWALQGRRAWLSNYVEEDELKLLVDKHPEEESALLQAARRNWVHFGFGQPRVGTQVCPLVLRA